MEAPIKRRVAEILVAILLCAAWSPPAHAACASPSGSAGDMRYNPGFKTPEYCDGASWVAMGPVGDTRTGLVGWWKFDDGSGTSAADSSGNGYTGTLQNSPTWGAGINGDDLTFNGSSNYVDAGDINAIDGLSQFTVSAWAKGSAAGAIGGNEKHIVDKSHCDGAYNGGPFEFGTNMDSNANKAEIVFYPNGGSGGGDYLYTYGGASIDDGNWHFILGEYDGANLSIWVDGVQQNATSYPGLTLSSTTNKLQIGGHCNEAGATSYTWPGSIDDVRFYNRALRAQDVLALYNSTGPLSGDINTGLFSWWKLDEGSGATTTDSITGNAGTLINGPTWTTSGKINDALTFDGVNDELSTSNGNSVKGMTQVTIGAWIKPTAYNSNTAEIYFEPIAGSTTGTTRYELVLLPGGTLQIDGRTPDGGTATTWVATSAVIPLNTWTHVAAVFDSVSGNHAIYINGALSVTNHAVASAFTNSNPGTVPFIGSEGDTDTYDFSGAIDDVRVYSRALSASDILTLYNSTATSCANPVAQAGHIIYNAGSYHVLQYCDGAAWKALGPVLASTGGGCSGPAGGEGDIRYNSAKGYMQYCNGANWIAMGSSYYGPQQGLVGWWKLDDGSGTMAVDSTGNGNTGTLTGSPAPTWTAGQVNGALTFNGTTNYVDAGAGATLQVTGSFTIAAWVNASALSNDNDVVTHSVASQCSYSMNLTHDNGPAQFYVFASSNGDCGPSAHFAMRYSNTTLTTGQWYHIVGVFNAATGAIDTYLNGKLDDGVLNGTVPTSVSNAAGLDLHLGNSISDPGSVFAGTLDDVRVYNRALSAAEVQQLYYATGGN